jgi:hypothetical protein
MGGNADSPSYNWDNHHHGNRPQWTPAVLQHYEQYDYHQWENRHKVKQSAYKVSHHNILA